MTCCPDLLLGHAQNHILGQSPQLDIGMVDALDHPQFDISETAIPDHQWELTVATEVMAGVEVIITEMIGIITKNYIAGVIG